MLGESPQSKDGILRLRAFSRQENNGNDIGVWLGPALQNFENKTFLTVNTFPRKLMSKL